MQSVKNRTRNILELAIRHAQVDNQSISPLNTDHGLKIVPADALTEDIFLNGDENDAIGWNEQYGMSEVDNQIISPLNTDHGLKIVPADALTEDIFLNGDENGAIGLNEQYGMSKVVIENELEDFGVSSDCDNSVKDPDYEANQQELSSNSSDDEEPDGIIQIENNNVQTLDHLQDGNDNVLPDNVETGLEAKKPRTRKRVKHTDDWKCNQRKKLKESGKSYVSKQGKSVPEKLLKPPCKVSCLKMCTRKISHEDRKNIFNNFWREGNTNDFKRLYVASNVLAKDVNRRVIPRAGEFRRTVTHEYNLEVRGTRHQVCRTFFLNTLSISEMYVKTALSKKTIGGLVLPDQRGKKKPPNKLDDQIRENVRSHINMFPVYESHYSRERSARQYLGNHINIKKMYSLYIDHCKGNNVNENLIAKEWVYRCIFNTEFNLGFKEPANDTCDDCDEFVMKLKDNSLSEKERIKLKSSYDAHVLEAGNRYEKKKVDKQLSKEPDSKTKVVMFDLQKCLPTPYLTNSSVFYLRKLWTFNLTILDVTETKAYCAMWDETVAARGAKELSSCLFKWALNNLFETDISQLTIWTDNCGGQNRNFPMIGSYFWILRCIPNLKVINHKFLLKGHTHNGGRWRTLCHRTC